MGMTNMQSRLGKLTQTVAFVLMTGLIPSGLTASEAKPKTKDAKAPEAQDPQKALGAEYQITNKYKHEWIRFPDLAGINIEDGHDMLITPKKGEALVVFFIASWCIPCQKLAPQLKAIHQRFTSPAARVVFVFSQDTRKDAQGFTKSHQLPGDKLLASPALLKQFHEPELPSVYVGDRNNWLSHRYLNLKRDDLKELEEYLRKHTGY